MIKLQSPIKPKSYGPDKGIIQLTQLFGKNPQIYSALGIDGHNGWDLRTKQYDHGHAPVIAAHDGIVVVTKWSETGGNMIQILGDNQDIYGDGEKGKPMTLYCHLHEIKVNIGNFVKKGSVIGISDNTGSFTTGSHLHFGFYVYWEKMQFNLSNNGFKGAIDPLPFMQDNYVYQFGDGMYGRKFFYNGKQIKRKEVDNLIPKQYKD